MRCHCGKIVYWRPGRLDETNRASEGLLAVQVHVGPAMEIQYRNFRLKHLDDNLPIITPDEAKIPTTAVQVAPQGGGGKKK